MRSPECSFQERPPPMTPCRCGLSPGIDLGERLGLGHATQLGKFLLGDVEPAQEVSAGGIGGDLLVTARRHEAIVVHRCRLVSDGPRRVCSGAIVDRDCMRSGRGLSSSGTKSRIDGRVRTAAWSVLSCAGVDLEPLVPRTGVVGGVDDSDQIGFALAVGGYFRSTTSRNVPSLAIGPLVALNASVTT